MAMRLTGIYSGLDTETIIQELVSVKKNKVESAKKEQTKLEWKQEKWKELNTKLLNLYTKTIGNMRFDNAYAKKVTKSSNPNAVSVVTGENAMNGTQSLKVKNLAKTAYMTGAEIKGVDGEKVTSSSKVSELDGVSIGANITLNGEEILKIDENTTISSVVNALRSKGLNANFDETNQRIFVGASKSGVEGDFELYGYGGALTALGLYENAGAVKIDGEDAEIELNGATFTSNTNTFNVNGLTITCMAETDEEITITTQNDTEGIYNVVKNFIKEYNSVINELDKVYNADRAKDYEPLTDDEKEEMSESEIEKWETKIKDSLLSGDSTVSNIATSLKQIMLSGVEVDGKQMYLSDFGIATLSYFSSADNEKHAYHIDGDADDAATSGNTDKLSAMIASDPETVTKFFTSLSKNLYDKLGELSKSVEGYSSFNSFYADKKMKEDYNDYKSKIADLEEKLTDYEDKWYAKFAAMETALAKLQSNTSAVTSMLGGM
ncbi:MAG: flagellar filament capping protein FliD [Lachnospiraceae bacterium]|nr:flagellar filament capping protein FliD [Lachnospiraceae bacterium]